MPFAGYKDFADCENQNKDKGDTGAYCGAIQNKVEEVNGSDWTNMTQEQRRNAILAGNVNLEEDNSLHLIAGKNWTDLTPLTQHELESIEARTYKDLSF